MCTSRNGRSGQEMTDKTIIQSFEERYGAVFFCFLSLQHQDIDVVETEQLAKFTTSNPPSLSEQFSSPEGKSEFDFNKKHIKWK